MTEAQRGSWAAMLAPGRRGAVTVLAGGTLMFAVDTYVTASLLPSAVAEPVASARWLFATFAVVAVVGALTARPASRGL